jgi:hypothetical protein
LIAKIPCTKPFGYSLFIIDALAGVAQITSTLKENYASNDEIMRLKPPLTMTQLFLRVRGARLLEDAVDDYLIS